MVTATRDGHTVEVSMGAFREFFAPLGYVLTGENSVNVEAFEVPVEEYDQTEYEEEKPITEMSFKELKRYAASLGIDTAGMANKRELKSAIMEVMHK